MINFYKYFIPHCAGKLACLTQLLQKRKKKNEIISFSLSQLWIFETMKNEIGQVSLLAYPIQNAQLSLPVHPILPLVLFYNNPITIRCNLWHYFLANLNLLKLIKGHYSKELLSMYLADKYFSYSLEGHRFTIFTDHQALMFPLL